jgi:16S rRNA (cytidine1402-2'-O)-methyltransferase
MALDPATLYIVATPIGNLQDLSERAGIVLREADLLLAEDTRRCRQLLDRLGLRRRVESYHDHSAPERAGALIERAVAGASLALVSDAGTPLIADPGYGLVRAARAAGVAVVAVPGPCAAVAALSVAGLPTDRFCFEGFLPARAAARRQRLEALAAEERTLVFYETPHRIADCLDDAAELLGVRRDAVLARELTKRFETVLAAPLADLAMRVRADADQQRGELVLMVHGAPPPAEDTLLREGLRVLDLLEVRLSRRDAVQLASRISGCSRNALYDAALARERHADG